MALTTKFYKPTTTMQTSFPNQVNTSVLTTNFTTFSSVLLPSIYAYSINYYGQPLALSSIFSSSFGSGSNASIYVVPAGRTAKVIFNPTIHSTLVSGITSHSASYFISGSTRIGVSNIGVGSGAGTAALNVSIYQSMSMSRILSVSLVLLANNYPLRNEAYSTNISMSYVTLYNGTASSPININFGSGALALAYSSAYPITSLYNNSRLIASLTPETTFYLGPGDSFLVSYNYFQQTNFYATVDVAAGGSMSFSWSSATSQPSLYLLFGLSSMYYSQQTSNFESWIMQDIMSLITIEEAAS